MTQDHLDELQGNIDKLQGKMERLMHEAETGEQWADICSIEAEIIAAKIVLNEAMTAFA